MIAVSAIRYAVSFVQRFLSGAQRQPRTVARPSNPRQGAATVLQRDPVCGTYVAVDSSLKKIVSGRVIHFCSSECRERYVA
jgi:YHS domain-containing protein